MSTHEHQKHECGGTILTSGYGQPHIYCDQCFAFAFGLDVTIPTGTDRAENVAAYDDGLARSPDATTGERP